MLTNDVVSFEQLAPGLVMFVVITCDDPRSEFGENRMIPDCTDSKYYYGVSCDLSCDYKLPLNGSSSITCNKTMMNGVPVGTWDWGQGLQPQCVGS